jgi:signal transduction histidine kinase
MSLLRSLGTLLLGAFCVPVVLCQGAQQTLTNCAQILGLSAEAANQEHPALVRAVVTCYVPSSQLCFVQDATVGIYIYPSPWPKDLAPGTVVEVEGVTGAGRFSPILQRARITPTGQKATVEPKRIAIEQLNTGRFDCQWVELEGVVQGVELGNNVVVLNLASGGNSIEVLYFDLDPQATNWVDARVRFKGVAGTYYAGEQLKGFGLFVPGKTDMEVIGRSAEPFARPMRTAAKLAWYSPEGAMDHRVHLRGLVTVAWPGQPFFLQDQSGSIRISAVPGQPGPQAGDLVEVAGFIRDGTTAAPSLTNALWKKIGSGEQPAAKMVGTSDLLKRPANGQLVASQGHVLDQRKAGDLSIMLLEDEDGIIPLFSRSRLPENLRGATIKASGAWSAAPASLGPQTGTGIWIRSTNDFAILSRPSAALTNLSPGKARYVLPTAAACLAIGVLLAWRGLAARRFAQERVDDLRRDLVQMQESRERLGRNLHDHIIQSIYAMGLNIEECRQLLNEPAKAEPRLRSALGEVNGVIRELRNVIQGLETNAIQPAEFRTALKSLALMLGDEKSSRVRLDLEQEALDSLTPPQATELVHIAREAVSNSVRHGKAVTTTFGLHILAGRLHFSIEDDGCGFRVETAESKGYGLRNMAKRAEALGAEFSIHSQEGTGTRIVLDIPKQKQHFSNSESRARINR